MNAIEHMVRQMSGIKTPINIKKTEPTVRAEKANEAAVRKIGKQIDDLHRSGMKLADIAKKLNRSYGGIRGIYSLYRRALQRSH